MSKNVNLRILILFGVFICDVISLLAQILIVSFDRAYKKCLQRSIENFLCLSFCDMTVPSKSNVPSL